MPPRQPPCSTRGDDRGSRRRWLRSLAQPVMCIIERRWGARRPVVFASSLPRGRRSATIDRVLPAAVEMTPSCKALLECDSPMVPFS